MVLRKEKISSLRKELLSRQAALCNVIRQRTAEMIEDESAFPDAVDLAAAETDRSMNAHMDNRERVILMQLNEALRRIDLGTFGECEQCGEAISEARIKAFPFTTLCIDCKAELESQEQRFSNRH
ncbi:MAG: TraR/DksA family transcriptional regulator [Bdellovibrionota bacterium]